MIRHPDEGGWFPLPTEARLKLLAHLLPVLLAVSALAARPAAQAEPERPPNVVYILADDLGWAELGCYGQEKIRTPNVDRLAAEGIRFTQHYSGSPVCASSRCVLLTGLHTGHSVVRDNWESGGWGQDAPEGQYPLPAGTVTLAGLLQQAGWATTEATLQIAEERLRLLWRWLVANGPDDVADRISFRSPRVRAGEVEGGGRITVTARRR